MSHLLISAAHKSSGKTTLSIGICAELKRLGVKVQPFKKGPDYIDPLWLSRAAGMACHNLDFYTQSRSEIMRGFSRHMADAEIGLIEGNKGLFDGLDLDGSNSNAALAVLLGAPVVLVLDTQGTTRGIAPLLLGYQAFDPDIRIAGVILNKVGGARHERKLREIIEHYTDIKVIGAVHRSPALEIVERHLGLMPSNESAAAAGQIESIRSVVHDQVDLELLRNFAKSAQTPPAALSVEKNRRVTGERMRIGIAMDEAFGFYYAGDLEAFEREGAELVPFSPITDAQLPRVDGIFIGGGFPEMRMQELENNIVLRQALREYVESGRPLYAECGGLMYLARSLTWETKTCKMVGVVPGDAIMYRRPQGRGYVRLRETEQFPWPGLGISGTDLAAHEFHYSRLENLTPDQTYAYRVLRGAGIDGQHDGIVYKNMLASYAHMRDVEGYRWVRRFLDYVRRIISGAEPPARRGVP
jgi:cobyrinic acid a,c-diamide synthase